MQPVPATRRHAPLASRGGLAQGRHVVDPTTPDWLVVLHPNAEIAASRAAVARQTFPRADVRWSSRHSDVLRTGAPTPAGAGVVLVHVDGVDRFRAGWGGHRVVARLAALGTPVVAWVAAGDRDGMALGLRSGAAGLLVACSHDHQHGDPDRVPELRVAVRGALGEARPAVYACPNQPISETDDDLHAWFESRYGHPWNVWIEPAVAVIVGGGERTEQAEALRASLRPATAENARRRLRQITEILCGEIRGNEAVLRREALVVLRRVARVRVIDAEPLVIRSLQRAARLVGHDPSLAIDAGLSTTAIGDLIEIATAEVDATVRPVKRRGRPEAGAWRVRRDLALGRVAERRGLTATEKLDALSLLRVQLDDTLSALYDALEDRERPTAV